MAEYIGQDLGKSTSYAYYVAEGGTKTPQEFGEMLVNIDNVATRAEEAAGQAAESASSAEQSKNSAEASANAAAVSQSASAASATRAENKAGEAEQSAGTASEKAQATSIDAETARRMAEQAAASAGTASGHAANAESSANAAALSKAGAETAKTDAVAAKDGAVSAKGDAEQAKAEAQEIADGIQAESDQINQNTADIAELQEEAKAGNAKQLLSKNTTADAVPYHFRQTGGNGADREHVDAIVGGTINWNQLITNGDFSDGNNGWSAEQASKATLSVENGIATVTALESPAYPFDMAISNKNAKSTIINGHIYLTCFTVKASKATRLYVRGMTAVSSYTSEVVANQWSTVARVESAINTVNKENLYIGWASYSLYEAGDALQFKNINVFDLTAMFGTEIADYIYSIEQATAGAGEAFFRKLFPNDYYPYNSGELKSVEDVSAHEMVWFNQLNPAMLRQGNLSSYENPSNVCTEGFIRVIPSTTYHWHDTAVVNGRYVFYYAEADANTLISELSKYGFADFNFTTPSNAKYIRIMWFKNDVLPIATILASEPTISLSNPSRNGEYEEYVKHSYPLDSTLTLRGIPKLSDGKMYYDGDHYLPDGKVERRYGVTDLGTLDWSYSNGFFRTNLNPEYKQPSSQDSTANALCTIYTNRTWNDVGSGDKEYAFSSSVTKPEIIIKDSAYTDAASFKAAMSGMMLIYELATPTIEEATPYRQLQICDPYGTEEFVSTGIVPVGHETRYPDNLRSKIEGLPWDFSSIIAPTEKTTTASRNYTAGSLLIMGNVLYKVTANIANGGTITPNTNVTATTLSEILSALAQ